MIDVFIICISYGYTVYLKEAYINIAYKVSEADA